MDIFSCAATRQTRAGRNRGGTQRPQCRHCRRYCTRLPQRRYPRLNAHMIDFPPAPHEPPPGASGADATFRCRPFRTDLARH